MSIKNYTYECLNSTQLTLTINFVNIPYIFDGSESYCAFLKEITPVFGVVLTHLAIVPILLVILITFFVRSNTDTFKWLMLHQSMARLVYWIFYDVNMYADQNTWIASFLNKLWFYESNLDYTSDAVNAINRYCRLYFPNFSAKYFTPLKIGLFLVVYDCFIFLVCHLFFIVFAQYVATFSLIFTIIFSGIPLLLSIFILLKIRQMKKMAQMAVETEVLADIQRASTLCFLQPLVGLTYSLLAFIMFFIQLTIANENENSNVSQFIINLYLTIFFFQENSSAVVNIIDSCLILFLLKTYRSCLKKFYMILFCNYFLYLKPAISRFVDWTSTWVISAVFLIWLVSFLNLSIFETCLVFAFTVLVLIFKRIFLHKRKNYLFSDDPKGIVNRVFSYIENATWNVDMLISAIIAINRLAVIVFTNSMGQIFTRNVVKVLAIMLFVSGHLLALVSHFLVPCCVHLFYYPNYWGEILDKGVNYNEYFIDIPINSISSTISIVCYATVYFYIRQAYRKIDSKLTCMAAEARRRKEVRYALQFGALSCFALFAWVSHRVIPKIFINDENLESISLVTFSIIIHGTMNSIIFLAINKVKKCVCQYFESVCSSTKCPPQDNSPQEVKRRYASLRIPLSMSFKSLHTSTTPHNITQANTIL